VKQIQSWNRAGRLFLGGAGRFILLSCLFLPCVGVVGQDAQTAATSKPLPGAQGARLAPGTIPALFLSDIHFEPFWDPGKVPQLAAAPISEWKTILAAPPSADRQQRFAALQQTCHARGEDTSFPLLESSMRAVRAHSAGASFATVSGDLMAHAFACKYSALFPHSSPGDYSAFAEKTVTYVMQELGGALPGVPIYAALGNNDSDCGDYQLDAHSDFLSVTGKEITRNFPASERQGSLDTFAAGGYYSIALPTPVGNARLLVLNDLFMSSHYATCAGKADATAADGQLAWLEQQLAQARRDKQKVWVMGHIPPGVDVHATVTKMRDVCGGHSPEMFLSSEKMADEMAEFSDVVELAIFAHTHMDELHVLKADVAVGNTKPGKSIMVSGVPIKMVPSISPIDGNAPSFTVARVDPSSAALVDYRVFTASNQTGVDAVWREEYDYARTYREPDLSASSINKLIAGFEADPDAKTKASQDYIRYFFAGNSSPLLGLVWPQYICSLSNHSAEGFRSCVCSAGQ
jgi:sphingomyelin phosphodiesterase acid-like 3